MECLLEVDLDSYQVVHIPDGVVLESCCPVDLLQRVVGVVKAVYSVT